MQRVASLFKGGERGPALAAAAVTGSGCSWCVEGDFGLYGSRLLETASTVGLISEVGVMRPNKCQSIFINYSVEARVPKR